MGLAENLLQISKASLKLINVFSKNSKTFDLAAVLDGCLNGKQSAHKQLYEHYYSFARNIYLRYAANTEEAE